MSLTYPRVMPLRQIIRCVLKPTANADIRRTHRLQIPTKGATLAFTEQNKRRLHARLCEVIGTEEADILMEQLPPITWTEFATKRDLDELRIATKHDIEFSAIATRTDLEQVITKTRTDLEKSIMEVKHSVETTKLELTGSILELTATMERGFRNQSWKMFTAIMSSQLVTVGLLGLMINSLR
jgi:hypothetical protein